MYYIIQHFPQIVLATFTRQYLIDLQCFCTYSWMLYDETCALIWFVTSLLCRNVHIQVNLILK